MLRFLLVLLALICASCSRDPAVTSRPAQNLKVLCGSSMAGPIKEIIADFEKQNPGVTVLLDVGGTETLFPKVIAGDKPAADIFICHDPFGEKVLASGRVEKIIPIARLEPVLVVKKGNPKNIKSLADLASPGLKIGFGDPRYSTAGQMFVDALKQSGLEEKIAPNIAMQGRTHQEIVQGLVVGPLDAVSVWGFAAALYGDQVEIVPTDVTYPPVNITVIALKNSDHPVPRDAFLTDCAKATAIFKKHGYATD